MKKLYVFLALLVVVLAFGLVFVSCDNGASSGGGNANIVGRWVGTAENYGTSVTFNSDNTFTYSAIGTVILSGTYSVSGNTVYLTANGETFTATVNGNTMDFGGNRFIKQ